MNILLLSISCAQGFIKFITPDELKNLTVFEEIATFSKVQLLPSYGKLAFADIDNCEIKGSYNENDVITIFQNDFDIECNVRDIAISAMHTGGGAFMLILRDDFDDYYYYYIGNYNGEGEELVYPYEGSDQINIFCLIIYGAEKNLKDYKKMSTIWVNYGYKTIPQESSPRIKYFMASDYSVDRIFFDELDKLDELYKLGYYENLYLYNFEPVFLYYDWNYDYEDEDCVNTNNTVYNISFCLYSNYYATGYERVMSTVIILNYYYSLPSFDFLYDFLSFLSDVYVYCENDYSEQCISEIVVNHGGIPNADPNILTIHHSEFYLTIPCYSINGVFIYTQGYLTEAYKIGIYMSGCKCYLDECDDDCTYYQLTDLTCNPKCNSTSCGYDNLVCLQENNCYIFTYGDDYCSESCLIDPDCDKKESSSNENLYFLLKIIIPAVGGVIIILAVLLVIYLIHSRRKLENIKKREGSTVELYEKFKKITFTDKVIFHGEAICLIDLKGISIGEKVVVIPECKHIIHYKCLKEMQDARSFQGCILCNQKKEIETNQV
ncbi:hypothetical protein SteCoe_5053 [Stentor coeruleus]|uniref:RING-type domain-containing protein n=1 Tax=Stentor coeruleus TaxID=5963 RepID=A0A1R2CT43_9CILI|nr:hypothetical protein SteCoe_5053 [Stentor coeruleus]